MITGRELQVFIKNGKNDGLKSEELCRFVSHTGYFPWVNLGYSSKTLTRLNGFAAG